MLNRFSVCLLLVVCLPAVAATLEQMSLEDLTNESTSIVRVHAGESRSALVGPLIYTFTTLRVLAAFKGDPGREVEVALLGGEVGDISQSFGGVPRLEPGREYLVFLWRGPSGLTQITGLSQGLLEIEDQPAGDRLATREPSPDLLIAPGVGASVKNEGLRMRLAEVVLRIRTILASGGQSAP